MSLCPGGKARRQLCGLATVLILAGCSSNGSSSVYQQYGQMLKQSFGIFSGGGITRQEAATVPYASLGYRIDDGDEAMLVLATDTGGEQIWTASNHVVFQLHDGRLTRTVGLKYNLAAVTPQKGTEGVPAPFTALKGPFGDARLVDYPELGIYSMLLTCSAQARGTQTLTILGQSIPTLRVDETCENRPSAWRFTDTYWLDAHSGLVWRSIQHIAPKGEKIEIEILRPPG